MIPPLKLFIVGPARSGTSTLYYAANRVLGLPGRGESHVIPLIQRSINEAGSYMNSLQGAPDGALIGDFDIRAFEETIFNHTRLFYSNQFGSSWVDKTPTTEAIRSITLIKRLFPDAKIVCTIRNGLEVVRSRQKKFNQSVQQATIEWLDAVEAFRRFALPDQTIFKCDQAFLHSNPMEVGDRMAKWLGRADKAADLGSFLRNTHSEQSFAFSDKELKLNDLDWSNSDKMDFLTLAGRVMNDLGYGF